MESMLDEDGCVSLEAVLKAFNAPVSEEQAWALAYETAACLAREWRQPNARLLCIEQPAHLKLHREGWVHERSVKPRGDSFPDSEREVASSESKLVVSLGLTLFRALDYGLCEDEERTLSPGLERLIDRMTCAEPADEGIGEEEDEVPGLAAVMEMCAVRKSGPELHYRAVCRALVTEVLQLSTFMDTIHQGTKELLNTQEEDKVEFQDWAHVWVQVVKELRQGVGLRKVADPDPPGPFELTPYERLLDDIRSRRYTLNKVMVNGDIPPRVKKDAHTLILEFIRSRPPLSPASRRKLPPAPPAQLTLYEKLMTSLKQKHQLRSTALSEPDGGDAKVPEGSTPPAGRRLIKADLTLRLSASFDDEDDLPPSPTDQTCTPPSLQDTSPSRARRRPPPLGAVDYWQSSQWQSLECLSLTLEEVAHIRSVLTKAELESLLFDMDLFQEVDRGKVCFTCRKTRFSFFGTKGVRCKLCERVVCDRCYSKMRIPADNLANIPVYLLSPTSSPPPELEDGAAAPGHLLWSLPHALHTLTGSQQEDVMPLRHSGSTGSLNTETSSSTDKQSQQQHQRRSQPLQRSKTVAHTKPRGIVAPVCCDCKELVTHIRQECHSPLN